MEKIYVIYWSMSGNTQAMAEAIAKGINDAGKEAVVQYVSDASVSELQDAKVFALGCPAMGAEVLEEGEMEPFVSEVEGIAAGKKIALFGSYGWGDGQWMRDWEERMSGCGAAIINGAGLICHETPDDAMISECENLGKQIAGQRFGVLDIDNDGNVRQFREKIQGDASPINIGYMICEPEFIDLIDGDDTVLEKTPMQKAAAMNEIMAYRHEGFWKCMDTVREKQQLEKLWSEGNAPWKTWEN